jgi:hypothetical protein
MVRVRYIGQTKKRFCDKFSEHRELRLCFPPKIDKYVVNILTKLVIHNQQKSDMLSLEQVTPKNDDFLRLKWEEFWTRNYQSLEFGTNKHSWIFL